MIRLFRGFGKEPAGFRDPAGRASGFWGRDTSHLGRIWVTPYYVAENLVCSLLYVHAQFLFRALRKLISRVVSTAQCIAQADHREGKLRGSSELQPDAYELSSKNISAHIWRPAKRIGALVCEGVTPTIIN